ncbi:MAG: PAS domain S-box protein [Desulfovibrio sp.]
MPITLSNFINIESLKSLVEQNIQLTDIPVTLVDKTGAIIFSAGTQDACIKFNRVSPASNSICTCAITTVPEAKWVAGGHDVVCENGIRTISFPITGHGQKLAFMILGHFFYDGEIIDQTFFKAQAVKNNFPVDQYLEAVEKIPRCSRKKIKDLVSYYQNLVRILSEQGITTRQLQEEHTLRAKAETNLDELNLYVKKLMTILPMPLFFKDGNGVYIDCNEPFEELIGLSKDKIIGKKVSDIAPPEMAQVYEQKDSELTTESSVQRYQTRVLSHDGRDREIILTKAIISRKGGSKAGVLGAITDVTDLKSAEKKVQVYKSYLEGIIDSMPSIIIGVDLDNTVSLWNKGACDYSGVAPDKAIGENLFSLIPTLNKYQRALQQVTANGEQKSFRMASYVDGLENYKDLLIYPLRKEQIAGAVLQITDVSERVKMEKLMVQAEKMMSMGNMSSGLAHELNNPLGSIIQGIESLRRRISPELPANAKAAEQLELDMNTMHSYLEQRGIMRYVDGMDEAAKRAAKIVHNVLNFSRRSQTSRSSHNINEVIDNALGFLANDYSLKKKFDFKKIKITKNYGEGLEHVIVSETELAQVLLNLLKNASQALCTQNSSKEDSCEDAEITITTHKENDTAVIEILDNGPGISRNRLHLIFDPFFTTKPVGEGVGLGLAVSYLIITENHGGSLEVDSEEGLWTKFTITLPMQGNLQMA